jgi:DNA ligase (NAD+)
MAMIDIKLKEIKELVDKLNYYTKLYDEGNSPISDKEWDDMYFKLVDLENRYHFYCPDSPTQKISYEVINQLDKVKHNHLMLSLAKTKSIDEIKSFVKDKEFICMPKLDGLTCSLLYEDGKLIKAETRGDGVVGEDITHNAKVIKTIPNNIAIKDRIVVDGEIICAYSDFEKFSKDYKNPRNFASGSIRLLDSKECENRKLTFIAWDCIEGLPPKFNKLSLKLGILDLLGFVSAYYMTCEELVDVDNIERYIKNIIYFSSNYPIDGVVFKFNDCEYYNSLGKTDHHFRGGLAYKMYDEEYETRLLNIDFDVSRMGVLTPVAVFEPVDIDGSTVSRASLHNMSVMWDLLGKYPELDQPIYVAKSNQIIPQITKVKYKNDIRNERTLNSCPNICPICGGETKLVYSNSDAVTLCCGNPNCDGKIINKLDHFCGKKGLDIKGLSKATLDKLLNLGWIVDEESIFELGQYRNEWIKEAGFGEKSVDNILKAIQNACFCDLDAFISAIGIPLVGRTVAKEICKHVSTWEDFRELVINKFDFSEWDTFGEEKANSILNFDYTEADVIVNKYITFNDKKEENTESGLIGLNFVITGKLKQFKNRDELKSLIERKGGKVTGSVTSKTNYLINNDIASNTAKNKTAKELNVPIITEDEFIKMI